MGEHVFVVEGKLPGLNEYTAACRSNPHHGASMKKKAEKRVADAIEYFELPHGLTDVFVEFIWFEPTRRRDKDNIAFAKKFILDSLVSCGILDNDGWSGVAGFSDNFVLLDRDEKDMQRVEVHIIT